MIKRNIHFLICCFTNFVYFKTGVGIARRIHDRGDLQRISDQISTGTNTHSYSNSSHHQSVQTGRYTISESHCPNSLLLICLFKSLICTHDNVKKNMWHQSSNVLCCKRRSRLETHNPNMISTRCYDLDKRKSIKFLIASIGLLIIFS